MLEHAAKVQADMILKAWLDNHSGKTVGPPVSVADLKLDYDRSIT